MQKKFILPITLFIALILLRVGLVFYSKTQGKVKTEEERVLPNLFSITQMIEELEPEYKEKKESGNYEEALALLETISEQQENRFKIVLKEHIDATQFAIKRAGFNLLILLCDTGILLVLLALLSAGALQTLLLAFGTLIIIIASMSIAYQLLILPREWLLAAFFMSPW